jgi:muramoyltetrapeptide carboxypeptidase
MPSDVLLPPTLRAGDKIRFVSPASTPDESGVLRRKAVLESWGLKVDLGQHVFRKRGFLAGTDEERLTDLNAALRDRDVRAIMATRGGKGSYRIADQLDFDAARADPKLLIGFSDITILHLSLWKHCRLVGIHGALMDDNGGFTEANSEALRRALMSSDDIRLQSRGDEPTSALTTSGTARGRLLGGNLDMVSTAAGWALPDLAGAILLLEAVTMHVGQVDRQLTMLRKAGHLNGIAGIALGQFTGFDPNASVPIVDLLRDHLERLGVPIVGGLLLGHGHEPLSVAIGCMATLDADAGTLAVSRH